MSAPISLSARSLLDRKTVSRICERITPRHDNPDSPPGGSRDFFQPKERPMYEKPTLQRYGTFREVTRGGSSSGNFDTSASNWIEFFFTGSPGTS